ncbi:MAG: hypothetical protein IT428_07070 [Planctomycetaceae bacterium]|nr:hypothetical protein [Planctomycetaceae bacterium]
MQQGSQRWVWLTAGLVGGLCLSYFWPHEPAMAETADRAAKFGLMTCPVQPGVAGIAPELEAVFVLDYLTGRLQGAVLNPKVAKFTHAYYRNVAADFNVNPNTDASYAMVAGRNQLQAAKVPLSTSVIYVGELASGKVAAYVFPYAEARGVVPPIQLEVADYFSFRQEAKGK